MRAIAIIVDVICERPLQGKLVPLPFFRNQISGVLGGSTSCIFYAARGLPPVQCGTGGGGQNPTQIGQTHSQ